MVKFWSMKSIRSGFTKISMYPKFWEASGIACPELIDRLIHPGCTTQQPALHIYPFTLSFAFHSLHSGVPWRSSPPCSRPICRLQTWNGIIITITR
ncbi:hypothetical protein [Methylobacillus caricis]|uniref:hypothetical protein n=1 Tax=Methylobacillus caricis TaxID=1971611 RepID=UPI003850F254